RILNTARKLFNLKGIANVSFRDLAKEANMSPGNLGYHYKNMGAVVLALYEEMEEKMEGVISSKKFGDLYRLQEIVFYFYQFQTTYLFFFMDLGIIARMYPEIAERHGRAMERHIQEGTRLLFTYVEAGLLEPEPFPGTYEKIAHTVWLINTYWSTQKRLMQHSNFPINKRFTLDMIWNLLLPHLTEQGRRQYSSLADSFKKLETQNQHSNP
ncbi:MAG: TetR/AcrR family transcriptional regulator, partial [Bacteroidota bacterium]